MSKGAAAIWSLEELREHERARRLVATAVRSGRLTREPCERCGATPGEAHHRWGYVDPLRIVWLCASCHGSEHNAMNAVRSEAAIIRRRLVWGTAWRAAQNAGLDSAACGRAARDATAGRAWMAASS